MARILLLLSFLSSLLLAHPHVFVDVGFDVTLQKKSADIDVSWTFDAMTSQMIIMDFDTDHNGKIDPQELPLLKQEAFDHLENVQYYTYVAQGKKRIPTPAPAGFKLVQKGDRVIYKFTISPKIDPAEKELRIGCFDEENIMALDIMDDKVAVKSTVAGIKPQKKIVIEDHDYYAAEIIVIRMGI